MKSSVVSKPHSIRILTVKVTKGEMAHFTEHALEHLRKHVKVDGFREGRVPNDLIVKQVGQAAVTEEAIQHALSDTYFTAIQEHKLQPIVNPDIKIVKQVAAPDASAADDEIVLEYTATVSILPEITLPNLDHLAVEKKEPAEPTDDEIETVLTYLRRQKAMFTEVDRPVAKGDWVDLGYEGTVGGVAKDGMKNEHHPIVVGEGNLIPGFEDNLIGMKKGETKKFPIRFPKDYHQKEVANARAEFTVTIHDVKEVVLPPFDTEFTSAFGFDDPAKMREAIANNLRQERAEEELNRVREAVLAQLDKGLKVDMPEALYEQEIERMVDDLKKQVEGNKLSWDQYLAQIKRTEEQLRKELRPQAEQHVRVGLALGMIVKEQKIEVKDDKQAAGVAIDWLVKKATTK